VYGLLCLAPPGGDLLAQDELERARDLLSADRPRQAANLLEGLVETRPTADAYLYLGIAEANAGERTRALEVLTEGSLRYPDDARFHNEAAGVHLANRNVALAAAVLERALAIDPDDAYANDLLASIRMSEGDVRAALAIWNAIGQPQIDRISQNFSPGLLDRTVPSALAFEPGETLGFPSWKTTEARLFASELYSNVALDLEPSPRGNRFNAIVNTSARRNTRNRILFDLIRGVLTETTYFNYWDIAYTGMSWRSSYRWDKDRRQLAGHLYIPLPIPGLPVLELSDVWRWERWNIERPVTDAFVSDALFDYKVNGIALDVRATPDYRVELHGGIEYRNRDVTGTLPVSGLGMDSRNSGTLRAGTILRLFETDRYRNQLRADTTLARASLLGDFDFQGGTLAILNRVTIDDRTLADFSISGGTLRGEVPIDHYYILGLGNDITPFHLRSHVANDAGRYGQAPMGTDFVLINSDIERRIATLPLFNTLSFPYVEIKLTGFVDAGRTFDRQRVFEQDVWYKDAGLGLRFETPTSAFTMLYGRDFTGHDNSFFAYVEPTIW
jgi:tetratricopeptide (TPR) repeat protein